MNVQINIVSNILKSANVTDVTKLSQADKTKVMAAVTAAATAANLTVTFGKSSTVYAFVAFRDASGVEVFRASADEKGLKVTGSEYPVTLYAGILLVLASGVLVARKAKPIAVK